MCCWLLEIGILLPLDRSKPSVLQLMHRNGIKIMFSSRLPSCSWIEQMKSRHKKHSYFVGVKKTQQEMSQRLIYIKTSSALALTNVEKDS